MDSSIGVYVIDRFTYYALEFLESVNQNSKKTIKQLFDCCPRSKCMSTVNYRTDLFPVNINKVLVTEFFGNVRTIHLTQSFTQFNFNRTKI
jgi:GPI-anchor transamidase subunit K